MYNASMQKGGVRGFAIKHHFQRYFSYIVVVSFIGGGKCTRRKPLTCASHWQTLSYNAVSSTSRHEQDPNSQSKRNMLVSNYTAEFLLIWIN